MNSWQAFVTVCRLGSLSAAAGELGYTQSGVSRQIAALEREIGVPLLAREARGVRPTDAGAALLPHARLVVSEADRGRRAATAPKPVREVAVGAVPSLALGLVPAALRHLRVAPGWTMLTDLTPPLVDRVAAGVLDLAVVTDAPPGLPQVADVALRHLFDDPMGVVLPADHRLAARRRIRVEDVVAERWLEDNPSSEALLHQLASRRGLTLDVDRGSSDLMTKIALVSAGHGIALAPAALRPALRSDVRFVELAGAPRRGIYAATRPGRQDLRPFVGSLGSGEGRYS